MHQTWWTDPSQLDDDQKKVISLGDESHLIIGPPGSGKTNLLLLRAAFLHKRGEKDILILTFNRVLKEFLATGTDHYPFSANKISTYNRWGKQLLAEHGITIDDNQTFGEIRSEVLKGLANIADIHKPQDILDCVLIDEAQDYSSEEIATICKFAEKVFAVGDEGQKIYSDKKGALSKLVAIGAQRSVLQAHYRNGLDICRVADGIRNQLDDPKGMEATSNYDEEAYPSSANNYGGLSITEQAEEAASQIETQIQAYPGELIGVLCPRHQDLDAVITALQGTAIWPSVQVQRQGNYLPFSESTPVILTTIHGAKGLEFRAVHLMAADQITKFWAAKKNLAFTAVTRAKTALSVYHDKDLPGWFEKGLAACGIKPQSDPDLDDLFQ